MISEEDIFAKVANEGPSASLSERKPMSFRVHHCAAVSLRRAFGVIVLAAGCVVAASASADPIVLATPAGLNPGDPFRFVFVTLDTGVRIDASSSDINVYNAFVTSAAGGATYDGSTVSWKAIGSTASVNARDNVGGFGDSVPVYRVDGTLVAYDLSSSFGSGFWGANLQASISRSIDGTEVNDFVWTGSNNDGTTKSERELGAAEFAAEGQSSSTFNFLDDAFSDFGVFVGLPMFAMSETLIAVPEPSTWAMALAGLACGGSVVRRRRTRA
jgi:hypothetical protein